MNKEEIVKKAYENIFASPKFECAVNRKIYIDIADRCMEEYAAPAIEALRNLRHGLFKDEAAVNQLIDETFPLAVGTILN